MRIKQIFFCVSYVLAIVGGCVAVAGAWLLTQPTEGANIGAGIVILGATALMVIAVVTGIIAVIVGPNANSVQARKDGAKRR